MVPEPIGFADASELSRLLFAHTHERVAVLGVPCAGKSTLASLIADAVDMDDVLFPKLTPKEKKFLFQKPWIPEVGFAMRSLLRKRVKVLPGRPLFATVVPKKVDFIIYLFINDELLKERLARNERPQPFELCKGVQLQLEMDLQECGIPWEIYELR